jgi:phage/plasmid-associated DNA primase
MRALRAVFDARDIPDNDEYKPFAMLGHDTGIRETLRFSSLEQRLENVTPSKRRRSVLWGFDESRLFTTVDKKVILQTARAPENAHTANLMALPGARYVLIDELNEIESIDFAKLKQLSGGDALNVRAAYGRENYTVPHPTHTFIISTNSLPAMPVDRAVTERVKVLSFNLFFNTQKREGMALEHNERYGDPLIEQKTQSIEFRRQFLRWLLHGALQFYRRGRRLDWCEGIQQDTSKFWQSVDYIGQFVDEMCDVERGDIAIDEALINQRKMYVSCMELYSKLYLILRLIGTPIYRAYSSLLQKRCL